VATEVVALARTVQKELPMSISPQFEWTTAENEAAWVALSTPSAAAPTLPVQGYWRAPWLWTLAGLLLLSMGGGVYALGHTAHAGWEQIEHELQDAVVADAWTAQRRTSQSSASDLPAVQVVQADVHGAQAVVQSIVTQTLSSGETTTYQTTDFYTKGAIGWVRAAPASDQFGPQQTLATTYLTIRHHRPDAAVARAIASRLDSLFVQACTSFGIAPAALAHQVTVELTMNRRAAVGLVLNRLHPSGETSGATILVPSPVLLQLPAEQPVAEWTYQAAAEPLVEAVLRHVTSELRVSFQGSHWYPLLNALRLWAVWQAGGPLADQRTAVIEQFYGATIRPRSFTTCQMSPLWQITTPLAVILCDELADKNRTVQTTGAATRPPRRLVMVGRGGEPRGMRPWGEMVMLETVVEHAVATYGVERLPVLLQALDSYETWADLIPAVYGVSAEEFEQGWRKYVADHNQRPAP
jgi:hypothetical protein